MKTKQDTVSKAKFTQTKDFYLTADWNVRSGIQLELFLAWHDTPCFCFMFTSLSIIPHMPIISRTR